MSSLRHTVGDKLGAMGDKLEAVEEKSKDLIRGFVGLFGRDGRIVSIVHYTCVSRYMCILFYRVKYFMTKRRKSVEFSLLPPPPPMAMAVEKAPPHHKALQSEKWMKKRISLTILHSHQTVDDHYGMKYIKRCSINNCTRFT